MNDSNFTYPSELEDEESEKEADCLELSESIVIKDQLNEKLTKQNKNPDFQEKIHQDNNTDLLVYNGREVK